jgi:regulator of sigma E protease
VSVGVAILALAVLVMVHEAGHFLAARAVGMKPRKFYLGFGPALVKTVRGGVEYGIGAFPLGGYVKIPGMQPPSPTDLRRSLSDLDRQQHDERLALVEDAIERGDDDEARLRLADLRPELGRNRVYQELDGALAADAYWRHRAWKRIVVIGAGPATNILVAIVLFVVVFMIGSAAATSRTVAQVLPGKPAVAAGMRPGDRIVAIGGAPVQPDGIATRINASDGKPITIVVLRGGRRVVLGPLRAHRDSDGVYRVGFAIRDAVGPGESLPAAFVDSLRVVGSATSQTVHSIVGLTHGKGTHDISSSVGIVRATSQAFKDSLRDFLAVVGLISLALALLNLLPVLPLDGGHIVMTVLERLRGRSFSQTAYVRYSAIGISLFVVLMYLGLRNDFSAGN